MLQTKSKAVILGLLILLSVFLLPAAMMVRGQDTLFNITLMVPSPNPSRQAWSEIVQNNLQDVGIGVDRVILDWGTIYDRALDPPQDIIGKIYAEGGFDMLFVGYAMGVDPDPYPLYDSSQFPPAGQNYYLWNNSENDRLGKLIKETTDETQRLAYVKEWQKLARDEQPSITILYTQEVVAFDPTALNGDPFKILHFPVWPGVEKWELKSGAPTTIVLAQTGPCPEEGINPWVTTSYYDLTVWGAIFDGLTEREDLENFRMVPALATSWEVAADQKTWTVKLRQGVKWHDGVEFTAADVKFTYTAAMAEELASNLGGFVKEIIGSPDNIEIVDDYTVKFHLPKPYAYFVESILSRTGYGMMLPAHVLENVPYDEWRSHTFNTGEGSYTVSTPTGTYTAYGPIGTGPYWYAAYDPTTFTNILARNDNYWNKQTLLDAGVFGIENYYVQFIEGSDAGISALKAGTVDVLDSQYHLETKLASIEQPWGDYISYDAFGVQEIGVNMQHPVLGTGVDTPLGKRDPSRAAEAARYVRQAISHLVPRQDIIDTILAGYGSSAVTTPITRVTAGFDETLQPYSYDVQLAKSLLAAAGYETGVPPPQTFLEQYGLYIAVVIVVVVVAVGAIYFVRKRRT